MVVDGLIADPDDPIFKRLDKARRTIAKDGLALVFVGMEEKDLHMKWSWVDETSGTALHMWDDYRSDVKYLELRAPDEGTMTRLRDALTAAVKPPPRATLLSHARKKPARTSVMRAVFGAGNEPDRETAQLVVDALANSSQYVREAAAYGAGILGWPEFAAALEEALATEREPRVQDMLRRSIALMRTTPPGAGTR
jgi:hypothetical protein